MLSPPFKRQTPPSPLILLSILAVARLTLKERSNSPEAPPSSPLLWMNCTFLTLRISVVQERDDGHEAGRGHEWFENYMTLSKGTSSMLGRGVKRKRSCLEELEIEVLHDAAGKAEHGGENKVSELDVSRLQQRQLVLRLCLEKLQHYKVGMELSLRRSVLLVNTLRQIQEEMRSDGMGGGAPDLHLRNINPDSCLLREDFTEDMPVTCPGCAVGDGESPSSPLSPVFPSQDANSSTGQQKTLPTIGDPTNATGYLSDLPLDDIFEDIDTSMYETSDLPSAWGTGSLWPISVSLWPDDDMKSHSLSTSTGGSLQSCLTDLNELDHIMEILVKS